MSEFEKWKAKHLTSGESKTWVEWCKEAFKAGQQGNQAIIYDLQNQLKLCREENKGLVGSLNQEKVRTAEISSYATELAEYSSYAEIIGAISHNRKAIRMYCDKVFAYNRAIDLEEDKALRGENEK